MSKAKIDVCTSYDEFNNLLSKARPKNSVVIAGMYNSLVNRILIGDHTKPGTKTMKKVTFVNVIRIGVGKFIRTFPEIFLILGLYTIPIDDHAIVRGHAVFDTTTVVQGYLYRHRVHVDRFFESASKAGLSLEFLTNDGVEGEKSVSNQKGKYQKSSQICDKFQIPST